MCAFLIGDGNVDNIIRELTKQIEKSLLMDCVPVGAVIVNNGIIVGSGHNEKENSKCSVDHAEIIAIQNACKHLNDWRLDECELYVSLFPCLMCIGATNESRIKHIYYFVDNKNNIDVHKDLKTPINFTKLEDNYGFEKKLKEFFKSKR